MSGDCEHRRLSDDISKLAQYPVDRLAPFTPSPIVRLLLWRGPKCQELIFGQDEGPTLWFPGNIARQLELMQKPVRSAAVHLKNLGQFGNSARVFSEHVEHPQATGQL